MRHEEHNCGAGQKSQPPGYSFESTDYEHFQLIFVRHGNLYFSHQSHIQALGPGECVLLRLGGAFKLSCGNVGYRGVYFAAYGPDPLAVDGPPVAMHATPAMSGLAEMMELEIERSGPGSRQILTGLGRALAWHALRLAENGSSQRDPQRYARYWAESARQALEAQLLSGRTARQALQGLSLSYRQLARHFHNVHGCSPKQYQVQARLREAERLLRHTDLPITSIAYELHFASSQHLATQFAKHAGQTPSAFRQAARLETRP